MQRDENERTLETGEMPDEDNSDFSAKKMNPPFCGIVERVSDSRNQVSSMGEAILLYTPRDHGRYFPRREVFSHQQTFT